VILLTPLDRGRLGILQPSDRRMGFTEPEGVRLHRRLHIGLASLAAIAAIVPTGAAEAGALTSGTVVDDTVRRLVADGAPGAIALVRTHAGTKGAVAGLARVTPRLRLRIDDRYRIASVTKTFVATVVLELVEEGKLALADTLQRRLPGLVPNGAGITVRHLLNHTSGLFDYDSDKKWQAARFATPGRVWTPRELVEVATAHPPLFKPGSRWAYSNTNYILLGLVIEAVTGSPLGEELERRLFRRLALRSTSYPTRTAIGGRFAHGYVVSRPPIPRPPGTLIDVSALLSPSGWGAGQIVSSAGDVAAFYAALLGGRLLKPGVLASMKSPVSGHDYGLGLGVFHTPCGKAFGHDGDFPGYRSVALSTPNGRRVAVVMVNIDRRVTWPRLLADAQEVFCTG
jgi:D-alanyl-D-alanine carboxypeptidase